jgi:putative transposase
LAARPTKHRVARPEPPAQGVVGSQHPLTTPFAGSSWRATLINCSCVLLGAARQSIAMRVVDPTTGREFFSKRRRRFDGDCAPRELTFSCYKGFQFFSRERTCAWFVEAVKQARDEWPVDLWAWVIMPEHVHLLVAPRESDVKIGHFQGTIKERVARQAIRWMELNAPQWIPRITVREGRTTRRRFWQPGGGYDRNVEKLETLQSMIDYFHLNPVRRGLVDRAVDWEWSSARWYAGMNPVHLPMDRTIPTIHPTLGGTP